MTRWLAGRAAAGAAALLVVLVLLVVAGQTLADPVAATLGPEASPEQVAALRTRLGLDRPLGERVVGALAGIAVGDFGTSATLGRPALDVVAAAVPATVSLAVPAVALGLLGGVVGGLGLALLRRRGEGLAGAALLAAQSVPGFAAAVVGVQLVAVGAGLLPSSGRGTLPLGVVLVAAGVALRIALLLGDRLVELTGEPFVVAALGRGLSRVAVVRRHLLRPAACLVVSVAALQFGYVLGGSVVVETVLAYPGLGRVTATAVGDGDLPVLLASAAAVGVAFLGLRLAADAALLALDPRVRDGVRR